MKKTPRALLLAAVAAILSAAAAAQEPADAAGAHARGLAAFSAGDDAEALEWFRLAARQGDTQASDDLKRLRVGMTHGEIAEGQRLAAGLDARPAR